MARWIFNNKEMQNKYPELWRASCALAGVCDGAITEDGVGYNGWDSTFMQDIVAKTYCTSKMAIAVHKMLIKYKIQLSNHGIDYNSIPKPIIDTTIKKTTKQINVFRRNNIIWIQNGFDDKLNAIFREHKGTMWDGDLKMRKVGSSLQAKVSVLTILNRATKELNYEIICTDDIWTELSRATKELNKLDASKEIINKTSQDFNVDLSRELAKVHLKLTPYPYQMAGILAVDMAKGRAIIGDEMGLGKTMQAIGWTLWRNKKALVICPASLKLNWKNEVTKWTNATATAIYGGKFSSKSNFTIINYELLKRYMSDIESANFDLVIIDESHYIKNSKAQRSKNTFKIAKKMKHIIGITGTGIKSRPIEFFTQLNLIDTTEFKSFWYYAQRYCGAKHNKFGWDFTGATNIEELVSKIRHIYFRRNKQDVLTELPDKIRQTIWIESKEANKIEFNAYRANEKVLTAITKARVDLSHHKTNIIIQWIENFFEEQDADKKLIVFSNFLEISSAIMDKFGKMAVRLVGDDNMKSRQASVDAFQNDPNVRIFTGTIGAAGVGITLTAADTVLFVDLPWTPGEIIQAEDRAHRIGQKNTVTIYQILFTGTIEQDMYELLQETMKTVNEVLSGKDSAINKSVQAQLIGRFKIRMEQAA